MHVHPTVLSEKNIESIFIVSKHVQFQYHEILDNFNNHELYSYCIKSATNAVERSESVRDVSNEDIANAVRHLGCRTSTFAFQVPFISYVLWHVQG